MRKLLFEVVSMLLLGSTVFLSQAQAQSVCLDVPANLETGVSFGTITAGTVYRFTATGTASYDCPGGLYVDPDGLPYGAGVTDTNLPCPALHALSLVGKVNGTCIQLGSAGTFLAPSTGELRLLMNDGVGGFFNNCGGWSVCIAPVDPNSVCLDVPAILEIGVSFGTITAGTVYTFTATGTASYDCPGGLYVDPDGLPYGAGVTDTNLPCPALHALSLVGKVNGICIQLGTGGTFVAPKYRRAKASDE